MFLLTAIVEGDIANNMEKQLGVQPDRPLYVLEYWVGHYDVYFSDHNTKDDEYVRKDLEDILSFNASLGVYMFHGGTNFGFTNGAYLSKYPTHLKNVFYVLAQKMTLQKTYLLDHINCFINNSIRHELNDFCLPLKA